ncbi:unnamed protein product, partial [Brassica rapa]
REKVDPRLSPTNDQCVSVRVVCRRNPSSYRKRCWYFASLSSSLTSALSELWF